MFDFLLVSGLGEGRESAFLRSHAQVLSSGFLSYEGACFVARCIFANISSKVIPLPHF